MIQLDQWHVKYPDGTLAIQKLSLHIPPGEHVALVGANGAGKSSLILSLVAILPASGNASVANIPVSPQNAAKIRNRVGVLFQNPDDQLFMPTIYDDIAFGPRNLGLDETSVKHRVYDRLQKLHIEHLKDKTPLNLSGGEKRLAALAGILAMKPDLMLMDEPTAFLDPKSRRNLIQILQTLPHTLLIATHDLAFAAELCPRILVLKRGLLTADGTPSHILTNPDIMQNADIEELRTCHFCA